MQGLGASHAVAHQEEREWIGCSGDGEDELMDVIEDEVSVACEAFVGGGVNGAAPAALVEGGYLDGVGWQGQGGEEGVVGIAVVARGVRS